ncbi:malate:quinone oxidoreductase, partial [Komagataeibacter kakiaceti]|uniref:malate:quinone oxidoreductase n=1 Tax=Komagataeibacter kakiaceti TaxID=943261 RepID=UPI00054EAE3B
PGASTAAPIMLTVLQRCFGGRLPQWAARLREIVPSYGVKLAQDPELCAQVRERTRTVLQLEG